MILVLFQYSDRCIPVLLIVSLAGIKVCRPDGKVSILEIADRYYLKKQNILWFLFYYTKRSLPVYIVFSSAQKNFILLRIS